jgi:hypothetical protein
LKFALRDSVLDPLRELTSARIHRVNCLYDVGAGDVFAEIPLGSSLNCPTDFFIRLEAGQNDYVGRTREFL